MGHAQSAREDSGKAPQFGAGDTVRVWSKITERGKVRLAQFEGIVVRRKGSGISESFTVRRVTFGEGVERVFPLQAPVIDRVEVLSRTRPRRARLYYLRTKVGKTRFEAEQSGGPSTSTRSAASSAAAEEPEPQAQST